MQGRQGTARGERRQDSREIVCPKTALGPLFRGWLVFGRGPPMADITKASPADPPAASSRPSGASTDKVEAIALRPLARAFLAAAAEVQAARRAGELAVDRTRPPDLRPAGRARQLPRSPGRHSGRQLAASPDVTGPGTAKSQPRPAGGLPVVDSDSLGSSS